MCHIYLYNTAASSIPCEALSCLPLKLRRMNPGDPGPLRFCGHLFIHAIHSLIQNPEEPQVSGWRLSQQLSRHWPIHESLTRCPLATCLEIHKDAENKWYLGSKLLTGRNQSM